MDYMDPISKCYDDLKKHNKRFIRKLNKYISLLKSYICVLNSYSKFSSKIDKNLITVPEDLIYTAKNLIPEKCTGKDCCCKEKCYKNNYDCRGDAFFIIKFNNKCDDCFDDYCPCELKSISMACLAEYCGNNGLEYLEYTDILFIVDDSFNIDRKVNQYLGFVHFFEDIIELLEC